MTDSKKRKLVGLVCSNAMDKTVTIMVDRVVMDPRFKKYYRRHKKYMAHDEQNQCQVGDRIEIIESRPLSKNKKWRLSRIIQKAGVEE